MELLSKLNSGTLDARLKALYPNHALGEVKARYALALESFCALYGDMPGAMILSAPGRTEIGGNHTDHNGGRVLAAAIDADIVAVAAPTGDDTVRIKSEGMEPFSLCIAAGELTPKDCENEASISLVRGTAAGVAAKGLKIGGFNAYTTSRVPRGSGLSSSAAFEVLMANIYSHLFSGKALEAVDAAKIAQYAENVFFKKPCGLMDQTACSVGGVVAIDFRDATPKIDRLFFNLTEAGYALAITDTHGSHSELTYEYAAIPAEMKTVASFYGKTRLRDVLPAQIFSDAAILRERFGDRAFLRAAHFFCEDERAALEADAVRRGDVEAFLSLVRESGRSSAMFLQNVSVCGESRVQPVMTGLCMSERLLMGSGASRVHGGGFAGTMQAFVPLHMTDAYVAGMDALFGKGSCKIFSFRSEGGIRVV